MANEQKTQAQQFTAEAISPLEVDSTQMAKMIFAEHAAGGEEEWSAVGNAAMNRYKTGRYGKNLQAVMKGMSSAIQTKSKQWMKADKAEFNDYEQRTFNRIKQVADMIVSGQTEDNIGGATHFENLHRFPLPYWAKEMDAVKRVGFHTYFKERPRMETRDATQ